MIQSQTSRRSAIAGLALSAVGLVTTVSYEGYTDHAVQPVAGDNWTDGFGTTGGVKQGDKITPPKALQRALIDVQKDEAGIKSCVRVPLTQGEYDAYVDLTYNIGVTAFCNSTIVERLEVLDYAGACKGIQSFICGPATAATQAKEGEPCYSKKKPRRVLAGLVNRRQEEYKTCMGKTK